MIIFIPAPWMSGTHLIKNMETLPGVKFIFEPWSIGDKISLYIRGLLSFDEIITEINSYKENDKLLIIQEKRLGFIIKELLNNFECKIIHFERNKYDWIYSHMFKRYNPSSKASEESLLHYPFLQTLDNAKKFFKKPDKERFEIAYEEFQKEPRKYQSDDRVLYISYRDLINAQKQSTINICNFIGIKYSGNLFKNAHRKSLYKERILKGEIKYGEV